MSRPPAAAAATAVVAVAATVLIALVACAGGGGASNAAGGGGASSTVSRAPATLVTIDRSGGLAGIRERVLIDPAGHWVLTGQGASARTGALSPDQLASLRALTNDGTWWAETRRTTPAATCADGYTYIVGIGDRSATVDDCTLSALPTLRSIVALLAGATAG